MAGVHRFPVKSGKPVNGYNYRYMKDFLCVKIKADFQFDIMEVVA
jgi:hypothetical protein